MNRAQPITEAMSYIPGMGISKQTQSCPSQDRKDEGKEEELHSGTEPKRPDHDLQVEEFLKEHYKSDSGPNMSNVGPNGERK